MYSDAGPVIVEPSRLRATGKVLVVLKLALLVPAAKSQPLNTPAEPLGMKNALASAAASVTEPGAWPPGNRPNVAQVLPPRLGGSYMTLWLPLLKSMGFRM